MKKVKTLLLLTSISAGFVACGEKVIEKQTILSPAAPVDSMSADASASIEPKMVGTWMVVERQVVDAKDGKTVLRSYKADGEGRIVYKEVSMGRDTIISAEMKTVSESVARKFYVIRNNNNISELLEVSRSTIEMKKEDSDLTTVGSLKSKSDNINESIKKLIKLGDEILMSENSVTTNERQFYIEDNAENKYTRRGAVLSLSADAQTLTKKDRIAKKTRLTDDKNVLASEEIDAYIVEILVKSDKLKM